MPTYAPAPRATLAVCGLLLNALTWGMAWWPLRWLESRGLHPLWSVVLTYGFACLIVTFWRPRAWHVLATHRRLWWLVLVCGINQVCFNWAMVAGDVVRVILLFYLMPVWMMLIARFLLKEPLTPAGLARMALALGGAYVILRPDHGGMPLPRQFADWLALIGGIAFAFNNVLLRKYADEPAEGPALAMFLGGTLLASVLVLFLSHMTPGGLGFAWDRTAFLVAILLGLIFLLGNIALQFGAAHLAAAVIGMVMLSEVVFAALSSALLAGEYPDSRVYMGGGLILAAVVSGIIWRPRGANPAPRVSARNDSPVA